MLRHFIRLSCKLLHHGGMHYQTQYNNYTFAYLGPIYTREQRPWKNNNDVGFLVVTFNNPKTMTKNVDRLLDWVQLAKQHVEG